MASEIELVSSVANIPSQAWDALAGENPALRHAYLVALEETGCANAATGWAPHFLVAREGQELVGAMPLYAKSHSYGEFVFDWAWAEAYEQNGLQYYPKFVCAVPFTPVSGSRILSASIAVRKKLVEAAIELTRFTQASSLHILFPTKAEAHELAEQRLMLRQTVQFHWKNAGFQNFGDFLLSLRHEKRKKIRLERKKLENSGYSYERIPGIEAGAEDWEFFYSCYVQTHHLYRSPIPLTLEFFRRIGRTMPENILLVIARKDGERQAAALFLHDSENLYGRSWGALQYEPGLHFEVCYYQAIEFCIEQGLKTFEGGAQGEHKLARGFLPTITWSAHWLAHPQFASAVDDFLKRETGSLAQYVDELNDSNPFKRT